MPKTKEPTNIGIRRLLEGPQEVDSVFAEHRNKIYKNKYAISMHVTKLVGGIPSNPNVAEGYIRSKIMAADDVITKMVADTMTERGISAETAVEEAALLKHLNGFKQDEKGLYIEGRQLKSCIKEAANIRWAKDRWGETKKGTRSFFAEHVFVPEYRLHLGVNEPSGIQQRFVVTRFGTGIQLEEYVDEAELSATVVTDYDFTDEQWADLWVTAEMQGIGACRSQSYGRFAVTEWKKVK